MIEVRVLPDYQTFRDMHRFGFRLAGPTRVMIIAVLILYILLLMATIGFSKSRQMA